MYKWNNYWIVAKITYLTYRKEKEKEKTQRNQANAEEKFTACSNSPINTCEIMEFNKDVSFNINSFISKRALKVE